jgi:hypothetical protein
MSYVAIDLHSKATVQRATLSFALQSDMRLNAALVGASQMDR